MTPVFSWKVDAGPEIFTQQAYQVTVSDDPDIIYLSRGNIWDWCIIR